MTHSPPPPILGHSLRIGPYELLERIGVGGMAEVFRARQTGADGFERFVAIKRILPGISADREFVKMFIDEAKIAVQLAHPNVAQIYDLGMDEDVYFIAQEYVHGRDMGGVVERQKAAGAPLPIPFVLHVGMKICEALQHAHTASGTRGQPLNIIHRDVSPSNVLVSYEGAVKVIDFGLAKAQGRLSTTQVGVVKGKLAYLSSEQARGMSIDSRSDLFSLGTCLFEWLTGQRLFLRRNDPETVIAIQKAEVPPLRALRPDVPAELQSIVLRALQPDPDRRYQTAMEMNDALLSFAYDTRLIMRRTAVGDYVRTLFPEDFPEEEEEQTSTMQRQVPRKRDTVPSAASIDIEVMLEEDDDDLITAQGGIREKETARPMRASDEIQYDDPTTDFSREDVLDALSDSSEELADPLDVVADDDVDDDMDDIDELMMTTATGARAQEILASSSGVPSFDDATADFKKEAVEMALQMDGFEDTTAPGKERAKAVIADLTGGFDDDTTTAISEDALHAALQKAIATDARVKLPPPASVPAEVDKLLESEEDPLPPEEDLDDFSDKTSIDRLLEEDTNPEIDLGGD